MKRKFFILAGIFMFFQFGFSLSCFFPHYEISGDTIMYNGGASNTKLKNADVKTFKELDTLFGTDKNRVYYRGKHIKNIDRETFEIVSRFIPVSDDPVWGIGCQTSYIETFKDKNGVYSLEDIMNGKLKLEE